ncbi:MAG: NeuD/PglB/VioB family sugar acetyltransferase [Phycisphaerales bacterium]|jgi:sugar O-acyltransferase (sialic acid O-acetyltransferase NeuD family)
MSNPVILVGGGGHARVVADAARAAGIAVAGFVDDAPDARVPGLEHLGPIERAGQHWHLCIGDVATRVRVLDSLHGSGVTIVHPTAIFSPSAALDAGVFIGPGAIVNAEARIDASAIVNSGAIIEHDARVGRASHVAPAAVLCGAAAVGHGCLVGAGAILLPGVEIGHDAMVGAGAVVRESVPAGCVAVGSPARVLEQGDARQAPPR